MNVVGAWNTFLRKVRSCGSGKIESARNCGYARMAKLRYEVRSLSRHRWSQFTMVSDSFLLCILIASFEASFSVPVFLHELFFCKLSLRQLSISSGICLQNH